MKLSIILQVLLYNGQLDLIVGGPLTERFLQVLQWSGLSEYLKAKRKVWMIGEDVAGYVRAVNNFYQVSDVFNVWLLWLDTELIMAISTRLSE